MAVEAGELVVRITGDASGLETAIAGANSALSGLSGSAGTTGGRVDGMTKSLGKAGEKLKSLGKAGEKLKSAGSTLKNFGESVDTLTKPLQWAATGLIGIGTAAATAAISFEDNFASVKKTVDATPEQLETIKQGIIDLSTVGVNGKLALPVSADELTEIAAMGGQLGIATDNIVEFTETIAQLQSATNLGGAEGASTMAKFQNVMGFDQSQIRNAASAIVELGNNTATTEADIAAMSLRLGKFGNTVNIGAADVLGYSAALSAMGIEAQAGGSALGRIWLQIQSAVSNGGGELTAFAKASGVSAEEFKEQWSTDPSGAFNGLLKGLSASEDLTKSINELGVSNTLDVQALMALANGYEQVESAVSMSNRAWTENVALQNEADAKNETLASQLQVTKNNVTEAARSFGEAFMPAISEVSGKVKEYAQGLADMGDAEKENLITTAKGVVTAGLIAKGVSTAAKGIGSFVSAAGTFMQAAAPIAPALIGIAVGAGAAAAGLKAWDTYENHWADGFAETADAFSQAYDSYSKLQELREEYESAKATLSNPNASTEDLEAAKAKIEEIRTLLEQEYNMTIKTDTTNLDDVFDAIDAKERLDLMNKGSDALDKMATAAERYKDTEADINDYDEKAKGYSEYITKLGELGQAARKLDSDWKNGEVSQDEYSAGLKKLNKAWSDLTDGMGEEVPTADALTNAVENQINTTQSLFDRLNTEYETALKNREDFLASMEEASDTYTQMLAYDTQQGDTSRAGYDETQLRKIGKTAAEAGLSTTELAVSFAAAKAGYTDFSAAIADGKVNDVTAGFIEFQKSIGNFDNEAIGFAALIKNGFSSATPAIEKGDQAIQAVIKDMVSLGNQNGLFKGMDLSGISKTVTDMAQSLGLIPDTKTITITTDGNVQIIDNVKDAIDTINEKGQVNIKINTEGNYEILDTADEKLKNLAQNGQITIKFNIDTGGFDINDLNGNKIGEITATGTVNWITGTTEPPADGEAGVNYSTVTGQAEPSPKATSVNYGTISGQAEPGPRATSVNYKLGSQDPPKAMTATVNYVISGIQSGGQVRSATFGSFKGNAKGTQNFRGGLAMVNDQTGISDPRELIIDKGRAFIPEGKNVLLPLSKGAKVYTAAQTKKIMRGLGIPYYASGKDNSDGFTDARDAWEHYTKTHAVTSTRELEEWNRLLKEEAENAKDTADAEEELFTIKQKIAEETNKASEEYIENRSFNNDWDAYGDDPLSAFSRFRERQNDNAAAEVITWDEAMENIAEFGEKMYDERQEQSLDWIEHQKNYCDMSVDDEIAAYQKIAAYTLQYYQEGLIDLEKYREEALKIDEKYLDAVKQKQEDLQEETEKANEERYSAWEKDMDNWITMRETYDDWDEYGDSLSQTYARAIERVKTFYNDGIISWQDAEDAKFEYTIEMYKAASDEYDAILDKQRDKIDKLQEKFSQEEQDLQTSWDVEDRDTDLDEVNRLLAIYSNSVTDTGMNKYKDLLEQKEQLERDEELYQLQTKHTAIIDDLEAEYEDMEGNKKQVLNVLKRDTSNLSDTGYNISDSTDSIKALAAELSVNYATAASSTLTTLSDILEVLEGIKKVTSSSRSSGSTYNDHRNISISTGISTYEAKKLVNGTIVSGLIHVDGLS